MEFELDVTRVMSFFPGFNESDVIRLASELGDLIETHNLGSLQGFSFLLPFSDETFVVGAKVLLEAQIIGQNNHTSQSLVACMREVAAERRYFFVRIIDDNNIATILMDMSVPVKMTPKPDLTKVTRVFGSMNKHEVEYLTGILFRVIETGKLDGVRGFHFQKPYYVHAIRWGVKALKEAKDCGAFADGNIETIIEFLKSWASQRTAEDTAAANTLTQMSNAQSQPAGALPADQGHFGQRGSLNILGAPPEHQQLQQGTPPSVEPFVPIGPVDDEDLSVSPAVAPAHGGTFLPPSVTPAPGATPAPPIGPVLTKGLPVPPSIDPARGATPISPSVAPVRRAAPAPPQDPTTVSKNTGAPPKRKSETPAKEPKGKRIRPARAQGRVGPSTTAGSSAPGPRPTVSMALSPENQAMMNGIFNREPARSVLGNAIDVDVPKGQNKRQKRS